MQVGTGTLRHIPAPCSCSLHPPYILTRVQVHVYTAHHNPEHCFEETLDGTFSVIVAGSWFPRHVCHRAQALCAYTRCLLAALWLAWTSWRCDF